MLSSDACKTQTKPTPGHHSLRGPAAAVTVAMAPTAPGCTTPSHIRFACTWQQSVRAMGALSSGVFRPLYIWPRSQPNSLLILHALTNELTNKTTPVERADQAWQWEGRLC